MTEIGYYSILISLFLSAFCGLTLIVGLKSRRAEVIASAENAALAVFASTGVDLDTDVATLTVTVTGAGNIDIEEADGVDVLDASTFNGDVDLTTTTGKVVYCADEEVADNLSKEGHCDDEDDVA